MKKRNREKSWFVILLTILFWPVGLYFLCKYRKDLTTKKRVVIPIFIIHGIPGLYLMLKYNKDRIFTIIILGITIFPLGMYLAIRYRVQSKWIKGLLAILVVIWIIAIGFWIYKIFNNSNTVKTVYTSSKIEKFKVIEEVSSNSSQYGDRIEEINIKKLPKEYVDDRGAEYVDMVYRDAEPFEIENLYRDVIVKYKNKYTNFVIRVKKDSEYAYSVGPYALTYVFGRVKNNGREIYDISLFKNLN